MMSETVFQFSALELVSLFGLVQSVYILVYITLRSGSFVRVILPVLFFTTLTFIFLLTAAESRWQSIIPYYGDIKWLLWVSCFPLSMLLVLKIIRITKNPDLSFWSFLMLVPVSYLSINILSRYFGEIGSWYHIHAIIIGSLSMLVIWRKSSWLDNLHSRKNGKERFWLIMSHIVMNIGLLSIELASLNDSVTTSQAEMVRILIGLSFVYIASTGLFRIFPQTSGVVHKLSQTDEYLSNADIEVAIKIENLLYLEKAYQEPTYGRSDMAKELSISEANLSRIIKIYFKKSLPQLFNELRVSEAKVFLKQTEADVITISYESGFNSIATFNRVFKGIEGVSPTNYRKKKD